MSKMTRPAAAAAIMLSLLFASTGSARISGGGSKKGDCYAEFDGLTQTGKQQGKQRVDCHDGDPSCDSDGVVNNSCTFSPKVCLAQSDQSKCSPPAVSSLSTRRNTANLVTGPLDASNCAPASTVTVPVKVKKNKKKPGQLKVTFIEQNAAGKPRQDVNTFFLRCLPCVGSSCTTTTTLPTCAKNAAGGPSEFDLVVGPTPGGSSELDNGTTGTSHNFAIPQGSTLSFCLSGCSSSSPMCQATGTTGKPAAGATVGKGGVNGTTFGAPLPLFAAGVPVCVINRYQQPTFNASYDVSTGAFSMQSPPLQLFSDVYLSSNPTDVCPRCTGGGNTVGAKGTCDSGPNQGQTCTVGGTVVVNNPPAVKNDFYALSNDCLPPGADKQATLNINLPLTTGTSTLAGNAAGNFPCPGQTVHDSCNLAGGACSFDCSSKPAAKGGINEFCCSGDQSTPCFPTSPQSGIGQIVRMGSPAPIPVGGSTQSGTLVATFCEAATHSNVIDTSTGLPGPGALILRGTQTLLP
jgi:hypothetical protein